MSEEEKEAIEELRLTIRYLNKQRIMFCDNEDKDNMQICLNLIEKQQKEIEELQIKLKIEKIDNKYNQEERDEETISKYKIREKIKELEDYMILFTNDKEKFNKYKYARDILEKLLKEN